MKVKTAGRHPVPRRMGRANVIAVVALFAVAFAVYAGFQVAGAQSSPRYAIVHDGDGGQTEIPLDGSKGTTFTIETSLGTNVIELEDGGVCVSEADCPNQDCVHQGVLTSTSGQIVCLPHKLWVELVVDPADAGAQAPSQDSDLDVVAR